LPGILLLLRAPFLFGYAKPVPVNFQKLRSMCTMYSSRISSAMLVRESRTSSAKGALGQHPVIRSSPMEG
jgi:hypothetical protein